MTPFTPFVDVPLLERRDPRFRRVAGLLADNATLCVATMTAGGTIAENEFSFSLTDANRLAEIRYDFNAFADYLDMVSLDKLDKTAEV